MPTDTKSPSNAEAFMHSAAELNYSHINRYPDQIVLTAPAENCISALAVDLILGKVELGQLSPALHEFYTFAWSSGREPLEAQIRQLHYDNDRLWMAAFGQPLKINHNAKTYAERQRILGHFAFADYIETSLKTLFGEVTE